MSASWMMSSVMVSMLIGAAALCVERVLMLRRGTPVRWVWMAAIVLSIGWSARWLLPAPVVPDVPVSMPSVSSVLPDNIATLSDVNNVAWSAVRSAPRRSEQSNSWTPQLDVPVPQFSEQAERRLRLASFGMSVVLLLALAWSNTRLMRERRRWRATSLLHTEVLVSEGFGPAIVGMRRPAIVVPQWVLSVDASAQRTILLHEDEHRRAGDQWLLLASFVALVLAPWNVVIWLMRRRLARTVELDCDERVLSHGIPDVDYANVLLCAWQLARGATPWVPSPALAEHVSRLGRRVEHLMRPTPRRRLMKTIGGVFTSVLLIGAALFVPAPQQAQSRPLPVPQPAQVPSVPTLRPAPSPSVPAPQREQVPSIPSPVAAPIPSVPAPVATPSPSMLAPAPSRSVPAPVRAQTPSVPAPAPPTADGTTQKLARLLVIVPWDSTSTLLARAVHERLSEDLRDRPVYVIPHAEFVRYASASGFSSNTLLSTSEIKALRNLVRADLVVALSKVRDVDGGVHVFASTVGAGNPASLWIPEGAGSEGISNSLIRALHADSAYRRLWQPQSGAPGAAPALAYVDSIAARLAETEIKRARALAIFEPWATTVRDLDAQVSAYQEQLLAMSLSASAPRSVAEFVLKRLDERQVALAINHRQLLVRYLATSPEVRVVAAEELHVEQRRAELRASLQLASEGDSQK